MGIVHEHQPRQPRPSPDQPGTLFQELQALLIYFSFPALARQANPDDAHQHARALVRKAVTR